MRSLLDVPFHHHQSFFLYYPLYCFLPSNSLTDIYQALNNLTGSSPTETTADFIKTKTLKCTASMASPPTVTNPLNPPEPHPLNPASSPWKLAPWTRPVCAVPTQLNV